MCDYFLLLRSKGQLLLSGCISVDRQMGLRYPHRTHAYEMGSGVKNQSLFLWAEGHHSGEFGQVRAGNRRSFVNATLLEWSVF